MTVLDAISNIREFVNRTRIQSRLIANRDKWLQLCSSMDVIEDTEAAITSFSIVAKPNITGQRYLAVYGLLQAMFVQQDAVRDLHEALEFQWSPSDIPELLDIRQVRNCSIGHPTKQGNKGKKGQLSWHHFIIQVSLLEHSFAFLSHGPNGETNTRTVRLSGALESQRRIISESLARLLDSLEHIDMEHRMVFKDNHLSGIFGSQLNYIFEKIYSDTRNGDPFGLGKVHFEMLEEILETFIAALRDRGLDVSSYPGIQYSWDDLEYPLQQLRCFFRITSDNPPDPKAAYIFTHYVDEKVHGLRQMAEEIDAEYRGDA